MSNPETLENWFEYFVRVHPHHTDYAGVVWHGTYLTWMEEARIAAFRSVGIEFADLVEWQCDLPVIHLTIDYHLPLALGQVALVRSCLHRVERVRMHWIQQIQSGESQRAHVTAQLTLVPVNRTQGRIIRKFPPCLKNAIAQLHPSE
ncbi:acyl-CoA thioesterase [Synechococcales cyanobacterium C]|uniref:Acyl-CoA thioesterase n=1 Tax=Petrachloros mirabilis ULC683 TaxID=2781853 RepID=A0A8K2A0U7_9CYAN|nr:thioesterase family protein [Petrachloros mirabilis]NCJ07312.1 acyl-CoA thioesterase [Petrachloros mirabilis ULC683]